MRVLFASYNGALDSLGQSQVLPYLREIRKDGHEVWLLTFERNPQPAAVEAMRRDLCVSGIHWRWLRYHKRPAVLSTLWDVACGVALVAWLTLTHRIAAVHARSQVSAAMAWPVAKVLRRAFIFDLRGQMAYEYADGGTWRERGLLFRLVERAERRFVRDADALVVLTRVLAGDVALFARVAPAVIPTCVGLDLFPPPEGGTVPRPQTMVYCGSLGARYALGLLVSCYEQARQVFPGLKLLIVTHSDSTELRRCLHAAGVASSSYEFVRVLHQEVPQYLGRASFGVLLLQGGRSLRGACPTKVAEYLAAGLPVLSSAGIGDCLEQLEGNRVGVVLKDHSPESFREGLGRLENLLAEGPALRTRCRVVADKEFSLSGRGGPAYRALYRTVECRL